MSAQRKTPTHPKWSAQVIKRGDTTGVPQGVFTRAPTEFLKYSKNAEVARNRNNKKWNSWFLRFFSQ